MSWLFDIPGLVWAGLVAIGGSVVVLLSQKAITLLMSVVGVEKAEKNVRNFIEVTVLRRNLYSAWTLTAAGDDEIDYVREHLNKFLAPTERHADNASLSRFRAVRRDDYLILRGPVERSAIDARHGVAIIHPLLTEFGRKFEAGTKTGADLKPQMIKITRTAKFFYISFAKADEGKEQILAEKIAEYIRSRMDGRTCVIARPTTDKALKILTRRGFKRCQPRGQQLEVRQTCFNWFDEAPLNQT